MSDESINRRSFLHGSLRTLAAFSLGGITAVAIERSLSTNTVWQLDPYKCIQCGRCATECVQTPSAVKCVHAYNVCGYCDLCGGYYHPHAQKLDTAAENQLCPTGAIVRTFIEEPYYQYDIIEELCIGCAKCVKGCNTFGNASLHLQVRHNLCANCNECSIARVCPSGAFSRVPNHSPYLLKGSFRGRV